MMELLKELKDWKGEVEIGEKLYKDGESAKIGFTGSLDSVHIKLYAKNKKLLDREETALESELDSKVVYKVTVKKYMTEPASPGFDFMAKWNNDNPMPLRTMTGTIEKETRGMVYMKLHGQAESVIRCMRCGRPLTNLISQHYGIGPECMSKLGLVCDINDVDTIKKKLVDVVWEGWVIKSSITEKEEL